ncbi:hypothetical protein DFH06DRAFT_1295094 [Mycena polygramma]|nr:hypothetical protein DFH06DRAFT_1295094 [Mycena polygramma]
MPALCKVTLQLDIPLPPELLVALSSVPNLSSLEIRQARMDSPSLSLSPLSFASLENLVICVWKPTAHISAGDVDREIECKNVVTLLKAVCGNLMTLRISGEALPPDFPLLRWPRLRKFVATEHAPTPHISIPVIISQMPALRELSVLFSADMSREVADVPPFIFGVPDGRLLTDTCSRLTSVTLSNSQPTDPIFKQLPATLDALHLVVARDPYIPTDSAPTETREIPPTLTTVLTTIEHISHLTELSELSLTLDDYATPGLIDAIADAFPRLRSLELGHSLFPHTEGLLREFRDDSLLDPLARLTKLIHLRIALFFPERQWLTKQRSDHYRAARWFFIHFPLLQSISFTFQEWFSWSPYQPLERDPWATYPRSLFPPELIPSPSESPLPEEIVPVATVG